MVTTKLITTINIFSLANIENIMENVIIFNSTHIEDISNRSVQQNKDFIFNAINCLIYLLCSIFSVILNLPLILNWIFVCKKENYADFLIISISLSDFIDGFLVCPIHLIEKLNMNLNSSYVLNKTLHFINESIDSWIWKTSLFSLLLLSLHRLKQLISPFKEGNKLNRFRVIAIVSMWFILPIYFFLMHWYKMYIKNETLIRILEYLSECAFIISICFLNVLIIVQFKKKMKNTTLNKNNFKKEKHAILCTLWLTLLLLITTGPYLIVRPFTIYKNELLHEIDFAFAYFYISVDPFVVILFNKNLRINLKFILKQKPRN